MPQTAQTDYLRLLLADKSTLSDGEKATLKRWLRDDIILDAVIVTNEGKKQVRVAGCDTSGDFPTLIMGDNTSLDVISVVSGDLAGTKANVGELFKKASVSENNLLKVTFSEKLPVGTYTGSIKTESETISSVSFSVSTNPSETAQTTLSSANATKLSNKAILEITITINGAVKGVWATPAA